MVEKSSTSIADSLVKISYLSFKHFFEDTDWSKVLDAELRGVNLGGGVAGSPASRRLTYNFYEENVDMQKTEFSDQIRGNNGVVRLHLARREYFDKNISLEHVVSAYLDWVNAKEFIKIRKENVANGETEDFTSECKKRGNGIYRWLMRKKLKWLDELPRFHFFGPTNRDSGKRTKALFITLTYDTKLCSQDEAWHRIPLEFNRWITRVRKNLGWRIKCPRMKNTGWLHRIHMTDKSGVDVSGVDVNNDGWHYANISVLRAFEAFKNGYPHIHLLLVINDTDHTGCPIEFPVVCKKMGAWRIFRNAQPVFEEPWHSFIDIAAIYEISPRLNGYIKKYILKHTGGDDDRNTVKRRSIKLARQTLALLWLYRRQSYAVSGTFRLMIADLILCGGIQAQTGQLTLFGDFMEFRYYIIPSPSGGKTWTTKELGIQDKGPPDVIPAPPNCITKVPRYCINVRGRCTDTIACECQLAGSIHCTRASAYPRWLRDHPSSSKYAIR